MSTGIDLPDPLRLPSTLPFVGRSAELELLRALMPSAAGEQRRVVLLAGEPGAGKSRLARELAGTLAQRGTLVLHGACGATAATPCGPFAEALEPIAPGIAPLTACGPDGGRRRLHAAVTALLAEAARRQPVLLVLEDGHRADAGTLGLLRHLACTRWSGRVLLLSTFRDTEPGASPELSETLAELRRCDDVVRLRLGPLSAAAVADFVSAASGCAAGRGSGVEELARAIHDLTGGRALLVCELWRALVESGTVAVGDGRIALLRPLRGLVTPAGGRDGVGPRLARPGPVAAGLLELADAFGPELERLRAGGPRAAAAPSGAPAFGEAAARLRAALALGIEEARERAETLIALDAVLATLTAGGCAVPRRDGRRATAVAEAEPEGAAERSRDGAGGGGSGLPNGLSPREAQILALAARGLSNKAIGDALAISEHTAANHIRSILRKTDCANRTEAASFAHRHGLAATTRRPLPRRSSAPRPAPGPKAPGRRGGRR